MSESGPARTDERSETKDAPPEPAMNTARATTKPDCEKRRILKILGALLCIACMETALYHALALPARQGPTKAAALSPQETHAYMRATAGLLIVDVRSRKEFADGHLPAAVNIPLYAFPSRIKSLPHDTPVLLHCQYGYRSLQAYKLLKRLRPDITEVRYVTGRVAPAVSSASSGTQNR